MQARAVIFGMQVDDDVLYRGIIDQPSHVYFFLCLSNFLSFHISDNEILSKISVKSCKLK